MDVQDGREEALAWRKSRDSGTGDCVEVASDGERILVRDSKERQGGTLSFTESEWRAFLSGVRKGEFDIVAHSPLALPRIDPAG